MLLPSWYSPLKALRVVTSAVERARTGPSMQRALLAAPDGRSITLPGFNLFSFDSHARVVDWRLPVPQVDLDDILGAYEEYADRRLGRVPRPERVARKALPRRHYHKVLGSPREPQEWWLPAATLIAQAFALSRGEFELELGPDWVSLRSGAYRFEVRYDSMWSNVHQRLISTSATALDADMRALSVEPLTTSHPLALAAVDHQMPQSVLWAINNLLRVEPKFEIVSLASERIAAEGLRKRRVRVTAHSRAESWGAQKAVQELAEAIGNGEHYSFKELYTCAVPLVMTARTFSRVLGSPWRNPNKRPEPGALQRFKEYLEVI